MFSMNYLKHLQDIFGNQVYVTEEANYRYNGEGIVCIVKYMQGSNYRDSTIQPVQLQFFTVDIPGTKSIIDTFTKTYSNAPYTDGLDYINQIYSTPMVLSNFNQIGTNYVTQFLVSATLIISSNITDIKQVYIDDELYETTVRTVSFTGGVDNQRVNSNTFLNKTVISNGLIRITMSLISKNDSLSDKLRNIRKGLLDINTTFVVKLVYTDNDSEEIYTMKCDSYVINSENQLLPSIQITFIQ